MNIAYDFRIFHHFILIFCLVVVLELLCSSSNSLCWSTTQQ